ncbi:MAG: hypothetical protein ACLTQI_08375 [Slackia sp.]
MAEAFLRDGSGIPWPILPAGSPSMQRVHPENGDVCVLIYDFN